MRAILVLILVIVIACFAVYYALGVGYLLLCGESLSTSFNYGAYAAIGILILLAVSVILFDNPCGYDDVLFLAILLASPIVFRLVTTAYHLFLLQDKKGYVMHLHYWIPFVIIGLEIIRRMIRTIIRHGKHSTKAI